MEKFNSLHTYIEEEDTQINKYLTFFIEDQIFGIPISDVVQITGMQEIEEVPEFPRYAKGIINLRGIIVPIIDVRLRLKKEEIEYNERTCIIVTTIEDLYIGFIVDSVNEVTNIYDDNISGPPQMGNNYVITYITGIAKLDKKIVILIDLNKLLNEKEIDSLNFVEDEKEIDSLNFVEDEKENDSLSFVEDEKEIESLSFVEDEKEIESLSFGEDEREIDSLSFVEDEIEGV